MAWGWTRAERRGACAVLALYLLGTAWDLWRAGHPLARPPGEPDRAPAVSPAAAASARSLSPAPNEALPLDLNRASESDLDRLPGIGPVLARRIAAHRDAYGPFRRVDDLRAVRGVGPRLFERIAPRVCVVKITQSAPAGSLAVSRDPARRAPGLPERAGNARGGRIPAR